MLDDLGASKGALYHYFDSKQSLLEGIVERYAEAVEAHLALCAAEPELTALEKLQRFFTGIGPNAAEIRLGLAALPSWYSDDNAGARHRIRVRLTDRIAPVLAQIVEQGVAEGAFTTAFGDRAGRIAIGFDSRSRQDHRPADAGVRSRSARRGERRAGPSPPTRTHWSGLLGAPPGSLQLIDPAAWRVWVEASREQPSDGTELELKEKTQWHGATT